MHMLQTLAYISQIAAGIGILVAVFTFLVHRNQLNFDVIMNCNERFQAILLDLETGNSARDELAKRRYVDLCNEQLFYFSNGYLPSEVIEEWLDGMIDYLPQLDENGHVRPEHPGIVEARFLEGYPRIKEAFTMDRLYDMNSRDQRESWAWQVRKRVRPDPIVLVLVRDFFAPVFERRRQGSAESNSYKE
jgi:hypothetical protein